MIQVCKCKIENCSHVSKANGMLQLIRAVEDHIRTEHPAEWEELRAVKQRHESIVDDSYIEMYKYIATLIDNPRILTQRG